ncbi:MAG: thioredoxin family protein [Pseudomonadota bacterium]
MSKDENLSLYLYVFAAATIVFSSIWLYTPQRIEVARLTLNDVELGAIETASIPRVSAPESWNYPQIPWRSYEEGMREIAENGKPAIMVMQADWCLVCRNYQRQFLDSDVITYAEDAVFILVDVEDQPELQQRYNVDGEYIPRTFALSSSGSLARDRTGSHPRQRFFVDPFQPNELKALLADVAR